MSQSQRIAVLGAGAVACHHAAAALALGHKVVAGSTRSPDSPRWGRFQEVAPEARYVAEGADLLDDPEIDAVIACLPWNVMPDWLEALLRCERPVLLEKPIALDSASLDRRLAAVGRPPARKQVGFNRRYYAPVRRLAARLAEGGLRAAQVTISEDIGAHSRKHGPALIPHLLAFASCHLLDLCLHLLGPLRVVRLQAHRERGLSEPFTSYNGLLETAEGLPVSMALNASDPAPIGIRCLFDDHSSWLLSPIELLTIFDRYEVVPESQDRAVRSYRPHQLEQVQAEARLKPGFVEQMRAFLSGTPGPGASLDDAATLMHFIDAIEGRA